jgi:hypothetical protein
MNITASLAREVGIRPACNALDVSSAGFYRWRHPREKTFVPALSFGPFLRGTE